MVGNLHSSGAPGTNQSSIKFHYRTSEGLSELSNGIKNTPIYGLQIGLLLKTAYSPENIKALSCYGNCIFTVEYTGILHDVCYFY